MGHTSGNIGPDTFADCDYAKGFSNHNCIKNNQYATITWTASV